MLVLLCRTVQVFLVYAGPGTCIRRGRVLPRWAEVYQTDHYPQQIGEENSEIWDFSRDKIFQVQSMSTTQLSSNREIISLADWIHGRVPSTSTSVSTSSTRLCRAARCVYSRLTHLSKRIHQGLAVHACNAVHPEDPQNALLSHPKDLATLGGTNNDSFSRLSHVSPLERCLI
jgi:hypothetical protein